MLVAEVISESRCGDFGDLFNKKTREPNRVCFFVSAIKFFVRDALILNFG